MAGTKRPWAVMRVHFNSSRTPGLTETVRRLSTFDKAYDAASAMNTNAARRCAKFCYQVRFIGYYPEVTDQ